MWKQGARPNEILQYRYSMLDLVSGTIAIPGEITKTGRARTIPMNPRVLRILKWLASRVETDLIFPSPRNPEIPQKEYKTGWNRACRGSGVRMGQRTDLKAVPKSAGPEYRFTIYNLRDTFITGALKRGLPSTFIGKYCDTSATMIDGRYAVADQDTLERVAQS
jgi:integrase